MTVVLNWSTVIKKKIVINFLFCYKINIYYRKSGKPERWKGNVLICYWCMRNYHRLSGLKQHIFIVSQIPWVRSAGTASLGPLLRGRPQGAGQVCGLIWGSESDSKLKSLLAAFISCSTTAHGAASSWQSPLWGKIQGFMLLWFCFLKGSLD